MLYDFGAIFSTLEDEIDWKDFSYHVAKDHTYKAVNIEFLNKLDAFQAWRSKMSIEEETEPMKKKGEVLPFQQTKLAVITGGKDGDGDDWFSNMEEGAVFISRQRKEPSPISEQWHVSIKWKKSTVLLSNFPHRGEVYILVSNRMFAEQNELIEILQERKEEIVYE